MLTIIAYFHIFFWWGGVRWVDSWMEDKTYADVFVREFEYINYFTSWLLYLCAFFVSFRLDILSAADDRMNFPGKRYLVSFLSWLDFCDQLISMAHPAVGVALAASIRQHFLSECLEPAILHTYVSECQFFYRWTISSVLEFVLLCIL